MATGGTRCLFYRHDTAGCMNLFGWRYEQDLEIGLHKEV
jgi:hypothetical protein